MAKSNTLNQKISKLLHALRVPKAAYAPLPQSLTDAAQRGDLDAVWHYLDAGADINERTIGFASPLHAACSFGHLEVAKLLHSRGAPLVVPEQIFSCIQFAAGKGFTNVVTWALDQGLPPEDAVNAMVPAAQGGHYELLKALMARVGEDKLTPEKREKLAQSARAADYTALAKFITGGVFNESTHAREKKRNDLGCMIGDEGRIDAEAERDAAIETCLSLLDECTDVNWSDKEGVPLLVRAVITGEPELVRNLLDVGADPNARADFGGVTALTEACALGKIEIVRLLLESKADINLSDSSGKTPLMYACARGDLAITRLLLSRGADTKAKDSTGRAAAKHISGPFENELRELLTGSNKKGVTK